MMTTLSTSLPRSPGFWPTYAGLGVLRMCARLPWSWLRAIGSFAGLLVYALSAERRRITRINLKLCFPELDEAARRRLARQCFRESGQALMELAAIWFGEPARIGRAAAVSGAEHIVAAQAQGRGVLLVGFHTNDLELGATSLAHHLHKMAGMYRPHSNVVFEQSMRRGREKHFPLIPRDDIRGAVRWLKSGGVLWYAPDQDYGAAQAVFAPFFNHPAATITATTRLAKLANAAVIPMTHVRTEKGIAITIHAPLPIPGDNETADASNINQFLEAYLHQHPSNYMWMHRRFKTQPEGSESLYPERQNRRERLSVRRYEFYLKTGVGVPTRSGADTCYFISVTHLLLVFQRKWWQPSSPFIAQLAGQLQQWQQQGVPCATWDWQARCGARDVDAIFLQLPHGGPLTNSGLTEVQRRERIEQWYVQYPQAPRETAGFWLGSDGQLYLLP